MLSLEILEITDLFYRNSQEKKKLKNNSFEEISEKKVGSLEEFREKISVIMKCSSAASGGILEKISREIIGKIPDPSNIF